MGKTLKITVRGSELKKELSLNGILPVALVLFGASPPLDDNMATGVLIALLALTHA